MEEQLYNFYLLAFDRNTDELVSKEKLKPMTLHEAREIFSLDENEMLIDPEEVLQKHISKLKPYYSGSFDLDKYEYSFETYA